MNDIDYLNNAEALLRSIELCCDEIEQSTDIEIDVHRNGGVLTIIFENKSQIVINMQKPLHEIWLASKAGGYHFKYDNGIWQDTKSDKDLYTRLSIDASEQSGQNLIFKNK